MIIKWKIKRFKTLSLQEAYELLRLRSEVFVVEQNCIYQDIDGKDSKALHVIGEIDNQIVAYARLFKPNDYFDQASIGRVLTKQTYRHKKIGHFLMKQSIEAIKKEWNETKITISAQMYLKKFYESHGFFQTSEMYLEDNIPHIEMKRE